MTRAHRTQEVLKDGPLEERVDWYREKVGLVFGFSVGLVWCKVKNIGMGGYIVPPNSTNCDCGDKNRKTSVPK